LSWYWSASRPASCAWGWGVASCSDSGSPMDDATHKCEVAWVDANDGDDETEVKTEILDQSWCQQHLQQQQTEEATP
jgi:hypothetical protein